MTKTSLRILLVDDDDITRSATRKILEDWGHDVEQVSSAPGAMAVLNSDQGFQVVLTDWKMPHVSGLELCRWIRKSDRLHNLFLVVITGASGQEHLDALEAGADSFVSKSFELEELRLALRIPQRIKELESRLQNELERAERANKRLTESNKELVAARAKAMKASRAKDTFLANMSHEIRTPMTGVIGMAQLLLQEENLDDKHRHSIQTIHNSATDLLDIINKVLDFSKLASSETEVKLKSFKLRRLLDKVLAPFQSVPSQKSLFIGAALKNSVPEEWSQTDPSLLRQILINLVGNAVKFTPSGSVVLNCRADGNTLVFEVTDTGPGIPAEARDLIFEEFSQADASFSKPTDGTGLGLAISSQLAHLLQGELGLVETSSAGSVFRLSIPAVASAGSQLAFAKVRLGETDEWDKIENIVDMDFVAEDAEISLTKDERTWVKISGDRVEKIQGALRTWQIHQSHALLAETTEEPKTIGNGKILLAEDNPINGRIMKLFLEKAGYQVTWKQTGTEVVKLQQTDPHDLILMDLQMPGMDGLESTAAIRASETATDCEPVPIIALTARANISDCSPELRDFLSDYLIKPVKNDVLFQRIDEHLKKEKGPQS